MSFFLVTWPLSTIHCEMKSLCKGRQGTLLGYTPDPTAGEQVMNFGSEMNAFSDYLLSLQEVFPL